MPSLRTKKRIGFCLNEKKKRKLNFHIFEELCRNRGYDVTNIDLSLPLCSQGPFDLIIHKLSDLLVEAGQDLKSHHLVQRLQVYLEMHTHTIMLDPLPAMHTLLDRFQSYHLLRSLETHNQGPNGIFTPPCVELVSIQSDVVTLVRNHLSYPIICKTRVAHGPQSHEMSLIFNDEGLHDVRPPCLLQSFINHSATLYKVFVVGSQHFVVQRPSLRNFPLGETDQTTIFFNSHDVSKAESCSHLSEPPPCIELMQPSDKVVRYVVQRLQGALGMSLFGVDLIIDTQTGRCVVIDVNAFPGYEGVPDFFPALLSHVEKLIGSANKENEPTKEHSAEQIEIPAERSVDLLTGMMTTDRWTTDAGQLEPYQKTITSGSYFSMCSSTVSADW
ncbi:inositol-tetrakisphosphate 1-kinase-like [Bombina bombina]|uniref:inositol-tetrakisphosphate 1-kinase-like n=1 Tax=Bombina bombina TaxID=8345 RepID=UPI00235B2518|nr:inositol-tetrakisphosphate 1-kinase-like [Bombina bombina]